MSLDSNHISSESTSDVQSKNLESTSSPPSLDELNLMNGDPYIDKSVSNQPNVSEKINQNFYFPYRQALALRMGFLYSTEEENRWKSRLGFMYLWPKLASPQAELGADILPSIGGQIHFGVRTTFLEKTFFRPFVVWGLTHQVMAREGLATFVDIHNYFFRGVLGMEDRLRKKMSVRIELELLTGLGEQMVVLSFGYSWVW
ncbi:MAG: hypothetical protein K1X29_03750 [Bdellovibrionales bacterium]|nr:hypothetical protein [Bdellovibrionales bacterium]